MTDAQLRDQALTHLRRTMVSGTEYQRRLKAGLYKNPGATEWGRALALLKRIGAGSSLSGSVPGAGGVWGPPPAPSTLAQNVVFCAENPLAALQAPARFKVALTADIHVEVAPDASPADRAAAAIAYTEAAKHTAAQQKKRDGLVACWGNQNQIGADQIRSFAATIGADFVIFQAETNAEFLSAWTADTSHPLILVGNPNAWSAESRKQAARGAVVGDFALIAECYTNVAGPWPAAYSSQGVPVASFCLGCYDGSGENPAGGRYIPLAEYKQHTPLGAWPSVSVYHAAGVKPEDWQALA